MDKEKNYAWAGVNIDSATLTKKRIKDLVGSTFGPEVLTEIGGFGGLFAPSWKSYKDPVLVASTDGVGTKLKIAFLTGIHHTVGTDLVSHCVNDILVQGARPLFFLDYLAMGQHDPNLATAIVEGIVTGCKESGCALLGGEIAEMPDFYREREYDLAGTIIGIVDRDMILDGSKIKAGDQLIGLVSSGLHTNGFSLARKLLFETSGLRVDSNVKEIGTTLGEALLLPHRCYVSPVLSLLESIPVLGMAHITGGGILNNLPRTLPPGLGASIKRERWPELPIFSLLQKIGGIKTTEMFQVFNMGIGMILIVQSDLTTEVLKILQVKGEKAYFIGEVQEDSNQTIHIV